MYEAQISEKVVPDLEGTTLEAMLINPENLMNYEVKNFYERMTNSDDIPPGAFWKTFRIKKNGCLYEALSLFFHDSFNNSIKHDTTFLFFIENNKKTYCLIRDNEKIEKTLFDAINSEIIFK